MDINKIQLDSSDGGPNRGTKQKTKQRILACADKIRQGYTRQRIIEDLTAEGIKETQANRIYQATIKYITPTEEDNKNLRSDIVNMLRDMAEKCIASGDKQNALKSIDLLNKVGGLYVEKVDANVNGNVSVSFDFGDLNTTEEEDNNEDNQM